MIKINLLHTGAVKLGLGVNCQVTATELKLNFKFGQGEQPMKNNGPFVHST